MPSIYSTLPGEPLAALAVRHCLNHLPRDALARALLFLPTRRSVGLIRQEFMRAGVRAPDALPTILALEDIADALPHLLPDSAPLPAAMPEWQRLALLTRHVMAFERQRHGQVTLTHALDLAQHLAQLQDRCARHAVPLTSLSMHTLKNGNYAEHWQHSLAFLEILSQHWPQIAQAHGMLSATERQALALRLLLEHWSQFPATQPVAVIGSTGSLPGTAALMRQISMLPHGVVILPGLDPAIDEEEWQAVAAGHPYYPMKRWLGEAGCGLSDITLLHNADRPPMREGERSRGQLWLRALTASSRTPLWRMLPPLDFEDVEGISVIPCAAEEEEARVVAWLLHRAVQRPHARVALITPDEGFMERVAVHLQRYSIATDRLSQGTLAATADGSLWVAVADAIRAPERMLAQSALLHHRLLMHDQVESWQQWLLAMAPGFRGLSRHRLGMLPHASDELQQHPLHHVAAAAMHEIMALSTAQLSVSQWMERITALLQTLRAGEGDGTDAVQDALNNLAAAEMLGPLSSDAFASLLQRAMQAPWRTQVKDPLRSVAMLTPIEARLERFDEVVLATMCEDVWPGRPGGSPWLSLDQQQRLGLPEPAEQSGLLAHDLLMLGSCPHVTITYAKRSHSGPATASRFLTRLLTLLALRGIAPHSLDRTDLIAQAYREDRATQFQPEPPPMPTPTAQERSQAIAVSSLDHLFSDPFRIYARHILALHETNPFDPLPEAKDFGTLAHKAIARLSEQWNRQAQPLDEDAIADITDLALRSFSDRPNVRLFWRQRLFRALAFVNTQEALRRTRPDSMAQCEVPVEASIALDATHTLSLKGRIDRLESEGDQRILGDYKSGSPPSRNDILKGKAVQLLAYALMLSAQEMHIKPAIAYWGLPAGTREGNIVAMDHEDLEQSQLLEKLRAALADFMNPSTPLLARVQDTASIMENPYDGISRYDEWAG